MSVRACNSAGPTTGELQVAAETATENSIQWAPLVGVGFLAVVLWTYHTYAAVMISPDSALFIEYARRLAADPLAAIRSYDQHPLYPGLILLLRQLIGRFWSDGAAGWILAGRLAGLAGYLGAVFATYGLAARAYEGRIAVIAAALVAVLPDASHLAADVLTDTPHAALYLASLAALVTGLSAERGTRWLLGSAALSALAFLTRPEGGAALLIGVVFVALKRDWRLRRRIALIVCMGAVFAAISSPYQVATGKLIKKKSLPHLLQFGLDDAEAALDRREPRDAEPAGPARVVYAGLSQRGLMVPVNVLYQWGRATRVVYAIPVLIGLWVARPRRWPGRILAAAFLLHALLLCGLQSSYGYLDRRHVLLLTVLAMPVAAAGVMWLARQMRPVGNAQAAALGVIGLCVLLTSPWLFDPVNRGHEHVRTAARWFAQSTPPDALLIGNRRLHRVALCADRAFAEWPWYQGSVPELAEFLTLHARPVTYVAVDTLLMTTPPRPATFMEDLQAELGRQLEPVFSVPAPPGEAPTEIRLYLYRPAPRS